MAINPSTLVEALQNIQDQVTCEICLEPYKQPKLLKCFHVFCQHCLQHLVERKQDRQNLPCPQCCQDTQLPMNGVLGLQEAFYIHYLFDIKHILEILSSSDPSMCKKCKKYESVVFCRTCGFVCQRCMEIHQDWEDFKTHEITDIGTLTGNVASLIPPLRKTVFCFRHQGKEADLYCETCDQLVCRDCIIRAHRDHQYDLVQEIFVKHKKTFADSLNPVREQIAKLEIAVDSVSARCSAVVEQKISVVAEIHMAIKNVIQALQAKERELVSQVERTAQQKVITLAKQRDGLEQQLDQLKSCQDYVELSQRVCNQGEILKMKSLVLQQIEDLTSSFKPEIMALTEQADIRFGHNLPELVKACQQFGRVYCHPVCPEKCQAIVEGGKVVMRGQTVSATVEVYDEVGDAYFKPVDSLKCELVVSDDRSQVRGNVERRNQNIYNISYQPQVTGQHLLHVLIEDRPIFNSPFTVTVLPNFATPANIIENLYWPFGAAITEGGEVVVAERSNHCVSIISDNREKKSFGTQGSGPGEFIYPEGIAIDSRGNILVADYKNHRIQQFSSTGKHLGSVGTKGSDPQFQNPEGIAVHPHTCKVYVADRKNNRIQVLNSDNLTYSGTFGRKGSKNGEFNWPFDVSTDKEGNVYVADKDNHRIQVFTADGVYLSQFGKKGEGRGELKEPVSIAIDNQNVVYVGELGNNRVSIFFTDGEFIRSFGRKGKAPVQFSSPFGLAVDKKGAVYISDTKNNRMQIFT